MIVESWIKTSENDKSVSYGLNEPIGTWFTGMKVNNDDIVDEVEDVTEVEIQDGEIKEKAEDIVDEVEDGLDIEVDNDE